MGTAYIGEIRICPFGYAPTGWMLCDGQVLSIKQYQPLFSLIGTTYGGDGTTTFALPDLQGRVPMHVSSAFVLGVPQGTAYVTLTLAQLPQHNHTLQGSASATGVTANPTNAILGPIANGYGDPAASPTTLLPDTVGTNGLGEPHSNLMPCLAVSFCIAISGIISSPT